LLDFADLYFYGRDNGNEFNRLVYPDAPLPVNWEVPSEEAAKENKKGR